jgi:hypothetical protein
LNRVHSHGGNTTSHYNIIIIFNDSSRDSIASGADGAD